jgi:hypothetical protein
MNRQSTWARVASGMVMSVLGGCGGGGMGGMGGGYGGSMNPSAPTASFSQPTKPVTVNLGQAVTVSWTSAYAATCSAATSSASGGAFAGSQAMSGTLTIVPTASGTYTYTLTCTGSGGSMSASSPTVTVKSSILSTLASTGKVTSIGSTVDPVNGDQNPYGLVIAPMTAGLITAGDLVVCNFNDGPTNTQGNGTTIIGLHPTAGSKPYRIAQSADLQGCNSLTMLPDDSISAAAFTSNRNPLVSAQGSVATPFASDKFAQPWGEVYATAAGTTAPPAPYMVAAPMAETSMAAASTQPATAIYTSDLSGAIDRISLDGDAQTTFTEIASGFCGSGTPGALFGPAGLTYDAAIDTLYIVDTSSASVVALAGASTIGADGVIVNGQCKTVSAPPTPALTFSGPSAASARVIAHGSPLIAPLSAALLSDGDLVVGNADINITSSQTPNLLIEVSPVLPGGFVGEPFQADATVAPGTTAVIPGALFGIAATVDAQGNQIVYFNDDNTNTVMKLSQ